MANSNTSLSSLHQNLTDEVTKMVRWETEKVVKKTDTESHLRQTEETIRQQEDLIRQLQEEKDQALAKNMAAKNKKKEIEKIIDSIQARLIDLLDDTRQETRMDITEKKQAQDPATADAAEIQSRDSRVVYENKSNWSMEKEPSNTDAGGAKGGDKEKVTAGKNRHLVKEASLFPMFFTMFGFRLVAACVMLPLGVLLLVSGNWLNSGEFGMEAVASRPWPNLEVEEQVLQLNILDNCALIGWILGSFMLLNFLYNVWTFLALGTLIYAKLPWAREGWNQARVAADEFLSKVREESLVDQFNRMTKAQRVSMARHDSERRRIMENEAEGV